MEWKVEYYLILFFAFAGVMYRLSQTDNPDVGTIWQRFYAQFYAWLFVCVLCVGLFAMVFEWHFVAVSLLTLVLSPVMERGIWLWMQSQNSSKSIWQFIKRFKRTWDELEKSNSTNQENEQT